MVVGTFEVANDVIHVYTMTLHKVLKPGELRYKTNTIYFIFGTKMSLTILLRKKVYSHLMYSLAMRIVQTFVTLKWTLSTNEFCYPVTKYVKKLTNWGSICHGANSQGARFLKIDLAQLSSQKRFDFRNS